MFLLLHFSLKTIFMFTSKTATKEYVKKQSQLDIKITNLQINTY